MDIEQCAICGSENIKRLENQTQTVEFRVGNKTKKFTLDGISYDKCQDCGEEYLNPDDARIEFGKLRQALAQDRKKKGLLTAEEIKEIRESLGFSQAQFEKILGLGAKSFARWETYRTDQSRAADLLLRAIKKGGKEFLKSLLDEQNIKKKDAA